MSTPRMRVFDHRARYRNLTNAAYGSIYQKQTDCKLFMCPLCEWLLDYVLVEWDKMLVSQLGPYAQSCDGNNGNNKLWYHTTTSTENMLRKSATKQKKHKTSPTVKLICLHGFLIFDWIMNNKNTARYIPNLCKSFFCRGMVYINRTRAGQQHLTSNTNGFSIYLHSQQNLQESNDTT